MFCQKCGKELSDDAQFCQFCGVNLKNVPGTKDLKIMFLLWLFLGGFGAHRFYLGNIRQGVMFLILNLIATFWYGITSGFAPEIMFLGYIFLFVVLLIDLVTIFNEKADKL